MQKRMNSEKGVVFTFEAIIAILIFALLLFSIPKSANPNLKELLIVQKANDLLKVWAINYPSESEMIFDTKTVFENNAGIRVNEKEITKCSKKNSISTEGVLVDQSLNENKITINVCYD